MVVENFVLGLRRLVRKLFSCCRISVTVVIVQEIPGSPDFFWRTSNFKIAGVINILSSSSSFSQAHFYFLQYISAAYFQMANFFRNKLVAGHAFHSATKVAALGILHAHPLLEPHAAYSEGLPYLREYIASLLWVDSTAFSVAAMRSLPAEARASLCTMFGLNKTPTNAAAQAQRIWHFIGTKRAQIASRASTQTGGTTVPAGGTGQGAPAQAQPGTAPNLAPAITAAPHAAAAALPLSAAAATSSATTAPAAGATHPAATGTSSLSTRAATSSATAAAAVSTRFVWPAATSSALGPGWGGGAAAAAGHVATGSAAPGSYGPAAPPQSGQIAGAGGAVQTQGGPQAQQLAGAGGAAQAQGVPQAQQLAVASLLDSMVRPAQVLAIAGLPFAAALALVQAAQIPTQVGDSDDVIRCKLTIAVWAAETLRSTLDFRSLPTAVRAPALGYLGVDAAWEEPLQDAFLTSALTLCQQAPWSVDPGQSQGLLSGPRMAFLALMRRIEAATGSAATSRARLQAAVPPGDFQLCEAALIAAGRSFEDVVWTGDAWSLRTEALASGNSTVGGAPSVAGSSAVAGALGSSYSGLSSVSHLGQDVGRSARQAACEQDYFGLKYDIYSFFTASENAEQKTRAKYTVTGEKRERSWEGDTEVAEADASALPLAVYPWNQSLRVYPSLSLSMLGRILRIALPFCNREVLEQMTQVVFKQVEQEQTMMYSNFLDVAQADWATALVMVPLFFGSAVTTMRMAVGDARQRCALFPESRFFASVERKRANQAASLEQFTEAVLRRVTSEVAGAQEN